MVAVWPAGDVLGLCFKVSGAPFEIWARRVSGSALARQCIHGDWPKAAAFAISCVYSSPPSTVSPSLGARGLGLPLASMTIGTSALFGKKI